MREGKDLKMKKLWKSILVLGMCLFLTAPAVVSYASTATGNDSSFGEGEASSDTKSKYYGKLINYKATLYIVNDLTQESKDKIEKLYATANTYIANNKMTESEIAAYISSIEGKMDAVVAAQGTEKPTTSKEFLAVGDNVPTPTVKYGESVNVILPVINLGTENLKDVVVTPATSPLVSEWPFEIDKTSYSETIPDLPGNKNKADAITNRREVTYTLRARKDVLSGYYKMTFNLTYSLNGAIETAELTTFVKTVGAPGSGSIDQTTEETGKSSTPRIIVTGFETNPGEVNAGSTFVLKVHVKNTSQRTAVSNVEFDLEAAVEGKEETATYSAFLPTSGSNTVYIDRIPQNGTADLTIEMTAKADLAQKPYVLNIKMHYEDEKYNPYEATASVSIPVKQKAKYETSTPEIMPASIGVGEQSNVMFSIYNTGKTTLYNVQVNFAGDSISGGDTFVGKIEPGGTGNVDAMVSGAAPTMDDGIIKANISFEDESGKVTTVEKEMNLFVTEQMMDMGMTPGMGVEEVEQPKSPKTAIIVAVIIGIVVIAVAGLVIFLKLKKKKKAARELAEDLDGIEETDTVGKEEDE